MNPVGLQQNAGYSSGMFGNVSSQQNAAATAQANMVAFGALPLGMAGHMAPQGEGSGAFLQDASLQDALLRSKAEAKVMQGNLAGVCHTCKTRMYQDGSDDPGVSFKSAANIDPNIAASVVLGHEMEHVSHERVKAELSGGEIVSQNVVLHTGICPECGRTYVAGGTTTTVSRSVAASSYAATVNSAKQSGLALVGSA